MILTRKQAKQIEYNLERYHDYKIYVRNYREDIIFSKGPVYSEGGHGVSSHSDITAVKALKLYEETMEEKWVKVIERAMKQFREEGKKLDVFMERRYFRHENIYRIMDLMNIERTTAYRYREEVIMSVAILAVQEKLIRI